MMEPGLLGMLKSGKISEAEMLDVLEQTERGNRDPLGARSSDIVCCDKDWWTPLHWCAERGHEALAVNLLKAKAGPNAQDKFGATPLMIASFNGYVGVVEAIVADRTSDVTTGNAYLSTALHYAARKGNADICGILVDKRAEVDAYDKHSDTPLSWAARKGHLEAVKKLLELGADPQKDNNASEDPIEFARANGHIEVAEVMEEHVGDPDLIEMSR